MNSAKIQEKKKRNMEDLSTIDNHIIERYNDINKKIRSRPLTTSSRNRRNNLNKIEIQSKAFKTYERSQQYWKNIIKKACIDLKRKPNDSVLNSGKVYREKIENANNLNDIDNSLYHWYIDLRNSKDSIGKEHYMISSGNSSNGLWMRIINDKPKENTIIRLPGSSEKITKINRNKKNLNRTNEEIAIQDEFDNNLNAFMVILTIKCR